MPPASPRKTSTAWKTSSWARRGPSSKATEIAIGYVLISRENIKDTILKRVYVVKYERHLIRWSFIFYKPYSSWILDYFNYDDAIEALFGPKVATPAR